MYGSYLPSLKSEKSAKHNAPYVISITTSGAYASFRKQIMPIGQVKDVDSYRTIDVKNVDPKHEKTLKMGFLFKKLKTLIKNADDKYTNLFKPNEKNLSKITVLV